MKKITDISAEEFNQKTVLVRVDYNVPIVAGKVLDDTRIKASLKTINFLRSSGASVILISHLENKEDPSLRAVAEHLESMSKQGLIDFNIAFHADLEIALNAPRETYAKTGEVHLFENIRFNPGEKSNDIVFAQQLAALGDFYINEAFPVCHRPHASIVGIPKLLPHAAGFTLIDELEHIEKGLHPNHPFIFILGGAKFESKLPLIEKFLHKADKVVIGGALFNDVLKAKGYTVGKSLVSAGGIDISHVINHQSLIVPTEVQVVKVMSEDSNADQKNNLAYEVTVSSIQDNESIVDVGLSLVQHIEDYILENQNVGKQVFVLWNGPMGLYEKGYTACTKALAELFLKYKVDGLVGGGDTSAAITESVSALVLKEAGQSKSTDSPLYISTGGGAMIEYLMNETLPGIEALQ